MIFLTTSDHQNPAPENRHVRVQTEAEGVIQVGQLNKGLHGRIRICGTACTASFQNLLTQNSREKVVFCPVTLNLSTLTACKPELVEPLQPR